MTALVTTILVFVAVGAVILWGNLFLGRLVRPANPTPEKGEVYECGEQPIGSAWVQFDARFYVVALLFLIFDVEVAFFFPWAMVFGSTIRAGNETLTEEQRLVAMRQLDPAAVTVPEPAAAQAFASFAFLEFALFFGILLVGFAYLWRRGDLEWVRSVSGQRPEEPSHGTVRESV